MIEPAVIPTSLLSQEFTDAWVMWLEYRKARKLPCTEVAKKMQLRRMAEWGVLRAVAAIEFSIAQNYQGVFEERGSARQRQTPDFQNARGE